MFAIGPLAGAGTDPQIRARARAIAEGYVEETLVKAYEASDPGTAETGSVEGENRPGTTMCGTTVISANTATARWDSETPTEQNDADMAGGALDDQEVTLVVDGVRVSDPATAPVAVSG